MMLIVHEQTMAVRAMILKQAREIESRADERPPTWNNNLRWHIGHLVVTPRLLTFGLMDKPLGVPADYRTWFAKGTSPAGWQGADVPPIGQLLDEMIGLQDELFREVTPHELEPFSTPYQTSLGAVLRTPGESLTFSQTHDGIHLGMIFALKRALAAA